MFLDNRIERSNFRNGPVEHNGSEAFYAEVVKRDLWAFCLKVCKTARAMAWVKLPFGVGENQKKETLIDSTLNSGV